MQLSFKNKRVCGSWGSGWLKGEGGIFPGHPFFMLQEYKRMGRGARKTVLIKGLLR